MSHPEWEGDDVHGSTLKGRMCMVEVTPVAAVVYRNLHRSGDRLIPNELLGRARWIVLTRSLSAYEPPYIQVLSLGSAEEARRQAEKLLDAIEAWEVDRGNES